MPYNWKIKNASNASNASNDKNASNDVDGDFRLNTEKCIPERLVYDDKLEDDYYFNFSKGNRILIYVRKDTKTDTSIDSDVSNTPNKGQEEKLFNPIMAGGLQKPATKHIVKSVKKCPDGKVRNPATGRCILSKNATKTVKDVKEAVKKSQKPPKSPKSPKPPKSPKKCPDGKVLNPVTGRCILSKNLKK
jgi:hypothetical protein